MTTNPEASKPKLMEQVRTVIRLRGMSYRTEQTYCDWIKRFILFHNKRHPTEMGVEEILFIFHISFAICHFSLGGGNVISSVRNCHQREEKRHK